MPNARPRMFVAGACAGALLLSGCLGGRAPKPGNSLTEAEVAVTRAEQARVGDYDSVSMSHAHENLAAARSAAAKVGDKDAALQSRWYAARAKADAELGIAHAEATRLRALTLAAQREIDDHNAAAQPATANPAP